jgi:hypothetical protein
MSGVPVMNLFSLYTPLKDAVAAVKRRFSEEEVDPLLWPDNDIAPLIADGKIPNLCGYRWMRPDKIILKTDLTDPTREIVWVRDEKRRTRRRVALHRNNQRLPCTQTIVRSPDAA